MFGRKPDGTGGSVWFEKIRSQMPGRFPKGLTNGALFKGQGRNGWPRLFCEVARLEKYRLVLVAW